MKIKVTIEYDPDKAEDQTEAECLGKATYDWLNGLVTGLDVLACDAGTVKVEQVKEDKSREDLSHELIDWMEAQGKANAGKCLGAIANTLGVLIGTVSPNGAELKTGLVLAFNAVEGSANFAYRNRKV